MITTFLLDIHGKSLIILAIEAPLNMHEELFHGPEEIMKSECLDSY